MDYQGFDEDSPSDAIKLVSDSGFNVIILGFLLSSTGPADIAKAFQSDPKKFEAVDYVHSKGGIILISFGGATDTNIFTTSVSSIVNSTVEYVVSNRLDGVDFDIENFKEGFLGGSMNAAMTVKFLADINNGVRAVLPNATISHAPQAPYFGPIGDSSTWVGISGGYSGVYAQAPTIDFLSVQFYNQGADCYNSFVNIFQSSCSSFPKTAIFQIRQQGIPLTKIVMGRTVTKADGEASSWLPASELRRIVYNAGLSGWSTGVMGWVWNDATVATQWIYDIYNGSVESSGSFIRFSWTFLMFLIVLSN
eukprot:TRINITY_DN4565_c0_g1_i1.p1 TRINITY_DN4565_c0_g1~~TRINITY_DN4565_c0_g1_i1.p1  ORF type:complete len:341 (-),score=61.58 TRINITY_DN4565_c0_g1_i1:40-960(-)